METIQQARHKLGLSQSEMAALLPNVSKKTLEGWEQGRSGWQKHIKIIRVMVWFHERGELNVFKEI